MATSIERRTTEYTITVDTAIADAELVEYGVFNNGVILVPTGSSVTSLTFHGVDQAGNTYAAQTSAGAAVTQTVAADKSYPIPDAMAGYRYFKMVSNADGTVKLQLKG